MAAQKRQVTDSEEAHEEFIRSMAHSLKTGHIGKTTLSNYQG